MFGVFTNGEKKYEGMQWPPHQQCADCGAGQKKSMAQEAEEEAKKKCDKFALDYQRVRKLIWMSEIFSIIIVAMLSLLFILFFYLALLSSVFTAIALLLLLVPLFCDLVSDEQTISLKIISSICLVCSLLSPSPTPTPISCANIFPIKRFIFSSPLSKEK